MCCDDFKSLIGLQMCFEKTRKCAHKKHRQFKAEYWAYSCKLTWHVAG